MTLRATLRWTGCGLLGHEDGAHAAFADLLQQLVRADRPCRGVRRTGGSSTVASGRVADGSCRKLPACAMGLQQLLDALAAAPRRPRRPGRGRRPAPAAVRHSQGVAGRCHGVRLVSRPSDGSLAQRSTFNAPIRPRRCDSGREIFHGISARRLRRSCERGVEPGPGEGPVAVGGAADDAQGLGGLLERQPGEVAELDQLGACRVFRGQLGPGPRRGRAGRPGGSATARSTSSRSSRRQPPPCLSRPLARGRWSTRMRRMASAAAAKKWPRLFQCCSALAPGIHQPQVRLVDQGRGLERLPGLLLGQLLRPPACAARRRPAAGVARRRAGRLARWRTGCA